MSEPREQKIKVSVGLTARIINAVRAEAKLLGYPEADIIRRWLDEYIALREAKKSPEKILVLDRAEGTLRAAR